MGLTPQFNIGEYVIDTEEIAGSESLVRISGRRPLLEDFKVVWNYTGEAYDVQRSPLLLKYKTTVTGRETRFLPLTSRISGP